MRNAATKFGPIDYSISVKSAKHVSALATRIDSDTPNAYVLVNSTAMRVILKWRPVTAPSSALNTIEWRIRVRHPDSFRRIVSVKADESTVTVVGFDADSEIVSVKFAPPYTAHLTVSY